MKTHMQTTWGSTVKLGAVISAIAAVVGVLLVSIGDVPQTAVVIGVMIAGFTASLVASGRPHHHEPVSLPIPHTDRRAA